MSSHPPPHENEVRGTVDHLVYGAPDLAAAVDRLENLLGVRATPGGRHDGRGTRNALIAIGPRCYLEILAPDPEQPAPDRPRWFGIDELRLPRLVGWAAKATGLEQLVVEAARAGIALGVVRSGSRQRPDGSVLAWRLTDPDAVTADRIAPFFIDWGTSPHPAAGAVTGVILTGLRAEHPAAAAVEREVDALGVGLPVTQGAAPALIATLATPRGEIELR